MIRKTSSIPGKESHIVKIAVELENTPDKEKMPAQLIEFNQQIPLANIITSLCTNWSMQNVSHEYSLKFCEINNKNYVTDKNRGEVKNGSVLKLAFSSSKTATDIYETLKTTNHISEMRRCLEQLSVLSSDETFALDFIAKKGHELLIAMIEDKNCIEEVLQYVLKSFVEIMDHGTLLWDVLDQSFIKRNIQLISDDSITSKSIIQHALSILENIVQHSKNWELVANKNNFDKLYRDLLKDSPVIQQNTVALINALFMRSDDENRKLIADNFSSKEYRNILFNDVIGPNMGSELQHQLYVLQTLTMGLQKKRMVRIQATDQEAQEKIKTLQRIAFDGEHFENHSDLSTRRQQPKATASHFAKLGFKSHTNPLQDFGDSPGMLALDCMVYFARNHCQKYTKVVHENASRAGINECPFGHASIELVRELCEILKIGETPSEEGQHFQPMFFNHDHPFEEFFCICIETLNKTWKDMRATNEDFIKVIHVVREQINRSLQKRATKLEDFSSNIHQLSYNTITTLRQQERTSKEECESTATAIVSLKNKITPEIKQLIKEQRLNYLVEGTRFSKYTERGVRSKDKFWYARLSPNHKVIHYDDCEEEKTTPALEELTKKLPVNEIKQLLVGKECPTVKQRKGDSGLFFSIQYDSDKPSSTLDFVAPDQDTFNYWTDGLNALLDLHMTSPQSTKDFEILLSMEIKLRLLDTEGIDISKDPPPIPEEPDNYDFCFES